MMDYGKAVALWHSMRRTAVQPLVSDWIWAYSYLRFSTPQQADGDSLRRQLALVQAWLKKHPNVRLDTSVTLEDPGVSALLGNHRKNKKHALALFLELVEAKRILPGSYLIVENLDRLSRENPIESMPFVLSLIKAGIRIVQLSPYECVYDLSMDQGKLISMLSELSRGHGESRLKQDRVGEAWAEKKRQAREGVPIGKQVPGWLAFEDGRYVVKPGAREAIRFMFRASAEGKGYLAITRALSERGLVAWTRSGTWRRSYVARVLTNRAVLGEYQPYKGHQGRTKDGEPIPGYYPAVVTEEEWNAARGARAVRAGKCGRPTTKRAATSPFAGLLWSANDGTKLHVKKMRRREYFQTTADHEGMKERQQCSFPVVALVDGLLSQLAELQAADLFHDAGAGRVQELQGRLDEVDERLGVALARFEQNPSSAVWADRIDAYEQEKLSLLGELKEAELQAATPVSASWSQAVKLMKGKDPDRLRQCLFATVKEVWCLFVARGHQRLAAVQVYFAGGDARRDYLIHHQVTSGMGARKYPPRWVCRSWREARLKHCDLRKRPQADALRAELLGMDWTLFAAPRG